MKRSELNEKLRDYARQLSPTSAEQALISKIYDSINTLLGTTNCIQIGSYPRRTAITPMHDLDVLYVLGQWHEHNHSPESALHQLHVNLSQNYANPTPYTVKFGLQTHSVTIEFYSSRGLELSVDIVPAYSFSINSYGDPTYKVPEIIKQKDHALRHQTRWSPYQENGWIHSDPRGYLSLASEVGQNSDFRKTTKIIKDWKYRLESADKDLKLKSFHLEQVVTKMFQSNSTLDLAGAIFDFFVDFPETIKAPNQIADRANSGKYVDDYIASMTDAQKAKVICARHNVLIALEKVTSETDIKDIFEPNFRQRNPDEQFMFDYRVPLHIDHNNRRLVIDFDETTPNRAERRRAQQPIGNKLFFKIVQGFDSAVTYFWKVKNSDLLSPDKRRGDITRHRTKNNPETTEWSGDHYVECYAVNADGICTDMSRVEVPIRG